MSINEEIQASSDSFWEIGQYKRTVKRIEDGRKLCDDLMSLIQERSKIEREYSDKLKHWSSKWNGLIQKGPEYGTTEGAWMSVLNESDRLADIHFSVKERLMGGVYQKIKLWQKDNYHKGMMGLKEVKEMDDSFKKAQKPWAKKYEKVMKAKKDFHVACRTEKSSTHQANNALADTSMSEDAKRKLNEKVEKARENVVATKEKYMAALNDINGANAKYMEDMTEVFNKCQDFEEVRLKFFKEALFSMHECLDISVLPEFPQIYKDFHRTIELADYQKDLKWWSNNHGVDMAMNWPAFEEYSPEMKDISKKSKTKDVGDQGIVMTKISHQKTDSYASNSSDTAPPANNRGDAYAVKSQEPQEPAKTTAPVTTAAVTSNGDNPFSENDGWENYDNGELHDDGRPGVKVRALYDYDGVEDDELTFQIGDEFEKLEDEDEQGWCKGRKGGRVGLYPANYVEEA